MTDWDKINRDDLSEEEKEVYDEACEIFTHGETWAGYDGKVNMEGHREKRQREYAGQRVECYRKHEKGKKGRY